MGKPYIVYIHILVAVSRATGDYSKPALRLAVVLQGARPPSRSVRFENITGAYWYEVGMTLVYYTYTQE